MADEYKIGDTVRLKSGGPIMTVTHAGPGLGADPQGPRVSVTWWSGTKYEKNVFNPAILEKANPPPG